MKKIILLGLIAAFVIGITIYLYIKPRKKICKFYRLVLMRHGEKPGNGLGNLDCKGLNRSLALPNVLLSKFGTPDFIFAPNPARKIRDGNTCFNYREVSNFSKKYNYIRPLVTIEPTAIKCNLPINSDYGLDQIHELLDELTDDKYCNKTIFVAWEHNYLDRFARLFAKNIMNVDNPESLIPKWESDDFDSIFIFTKQDSYTNTFEYEFSIDKENLNSVSNICPSS